MTEARKHQESEKLRKEVTEEKKGIKREGRIR